MTRVRIATFNVRHGRGRDGTVDLERTADAIRSTGASFIALQELDRGMARSGGVDQPEVLATLTGLHVAFWPTLARGGGLYGIGFAATMPVVAEFAMLPRRDREEPRGMAVVDAGEFRIVIAHLSRDPRARPLQIEALAGVAAAAPGPVVVAGDLNTTAAGLGSLYDAGFLGPPDPPPTLARGGRAIDHVLAGPGVGLERVATIPSEASDHLPLAADLLLTE